MNHPTPDDPRFAAFVGIDWADDQHAVALHDPQRPASVHHRTLPHTPRPSTTGPWACGNDSTAGPSPSPSNSPADP